MRKSSVTIEYLLLVVLIIFTFSAEYTFLKEYGKSNPPYYLYLKNTFINQFNTCKNLNIEQCKINLYSNVFFTKTFISCKDNKIHIVSPKKDINLNIFCDNNGFKKELKTTDYIIYNFKTKKLS